MVSENSGNSFFVNQNSAPTAFVLALHLAEKYRRLADLIRAAPPSEKLAAFMRAASETARLVGPDFPKSEAADRLWATAEAHGLVVNYGTDTIQTALGNALDGPVPLVESVLLDDDPAGEDNSPKTAADRRSSNRPKQADILVRLARANAELFHTADGIGFADIRVSGHRETWPVRSRGFKLWLVREYYKAEAGAPNSDAMQAALNLLDAIARFEGVEIAVNVRIAGTADQIYIDLGSSDWSAIEIDCDGWRVVSEPPVRFRRSKGMLALPVPAHDGNVNVLRYFLNVKSDRDFALIIAWLIAALRNRGPYPVLVLNGEHGTAKSTLTRILRAVVDPNSASLRSLPRDDRDLFIAANNSYLMAFDNVSKLAAWLSDSLARLATGGGFGTRELYTDNEESLFDAMRPIILNGIEDFVTRGDLADRAVSLELNEIPENERRDEESFWAEFNAAAPGILGAVLDVLACGLQRLPHIKLERKPRMADFAKWVTACEAKLPWKAGFFMRAYDTNRAEAVETTLESDAIATGLRALLENNRKWSGTAADMLKALNERTPDDLRDGQNWPKTPRGMSGALRRIAPGLRKIGYMVEFGERESNALRNRIIHICSPVSAGQEPSEPSKHRSNGASGSVGTIDGWNSTSKGPSRQPSNQESLTDVVSDRSDSSDGVAPGSAAVNWYGLVEAES